MGLQTLAYNGYIEVDWAGAEKEIMRRATNGKSGQVDAKVANELYDKVMEVVGYNIPAGSGFGGGVIVGLRSG